MSEILRQEGVNTPVERFLYDIWYRLPHSEQRLFLTPEKAEVEIAGMINAYQYVDLLLRKDRLAVSEETIRNIHRKICKFRDEIYQSYEDEGLGRRIGGIYWIGGKKVVSPYPFGMVSPEEFYPKLEELAEIFSKAMNPLNSFEEIPLKVSQAADVHCRLVHLHPFPDANGRTAAVLTDMVLMRAGLPQIPIWLPKDWYYKALFDSVTEQTTVPMEQFIGQRILWGCQAQMMGLTEEEGLETQARRSSDFETIKSQIAILDEKYGSSAQTF